MKGKITWVLGLALAVLATVSLSATGTKEPSKMVLGRVSFDLRHPYQQADAKWFETFAKEKGIDVITMDGKASAEAMTKATEDLIAKKVSGIVIQPADNANADAVATEAHQAKIPLVTFVNEAFNAKAPHVELYEAETSMAMGKLAATKWKGWYPDKPMVIGVIDFPLLPRFTSKELSPSSRAFSLSTRARRLPPSLTVGGFGTSQWPPPKT